MKVTCLNFAGVEVCTQRVHGKVCFAGTVSTETWRKQRGEEAAPEGRQDGARCTFTEWSLPFRTSGSLGFLPKAAKRLRAGSAWIGPWSKYQVATKVWCHRCLEEPFQTLHHGLVTGCWADTKLLDG